MKHCPKCGGARHCRLGDGRFKRCACGRRLSWTSVWDSVRLPAKVKHRLLRACCAQVEQPREIPSKAPCTTPMSGRRTPHSSCTASMW